MASNDKNGFAVTEKGIISSWPTEGEAITSWPPEEEAITSWSPEGEAITSWPPEEEAITSWPPEGEAITSWPPEGEALSSRLLENYKYSPDKDSLEANCVLKTDKRGFSKTGLQEARISLAIWFR